jgi:hypothetical protein
VNLDTGSCRCKGSWISYAPKKDLGKEEKCAGAQQTSEC